MKTKKIFISLTGGLTAVMGGVLVTTVCATPLVNTFRSQVDDILGTQSIEFDTEHSRFKSSYDTIDQVITEAKKVSIKEGQEGTVIMKNNGVLPLATTGTGVRKVALFGTHVWKGYPYAPGDLKAGNADAIDIPTAIEEAGLLIDEGSLIFKKISDKYLVEKPGQWGAPPTIEYSLVGAPGDMGKYPVKVIPMDEVGTEGEDSSWESKFDSNSVAIVMISRGAGESNTYSPTESALDWHDNETGKPALALQPDELATIKKAKELCSKVVVLINSGNNLELGPISVPGDYEADAIAYVGTLNDYQSKGVVDVLTGKVNATGRMADTYVYDNLSAPASVNVGHHSYAHPEQITAGGDSRWAASLGYNMPSSFGGGPTYAAETYIVEAEGIYVGYKYYETRYFDSVANKGFKADSTAGARHSSAGWKYDEEVLYTFGSGESYIPYTQKIKSVNVNKTENGLTRAVIEVKNEGTKDGLFTTQLYFSAPYTQYDRQNLVEKSAVNFLNSAKVEVAAGETEEVTIEIPTHYLASWDSNARSGKGSYILDEGNYYFTAANGAHDAANNVLKALNKTAADGMIGESTGPVATWTGVATRDETTFSVSNGVEVKNQLADADANYYFEGAVDYLTRQDWSKWVKNYISSETLDISTANKKAELIKALRNEIYRMTTDTPAVEATDNNVSFKEIPPEALEDAHDEYWDKLVHEITINQAVGGIIHGGSRTEDLENIENPVVNQNEGVSGYTGAYAFGSEEESVWKDNYHSPVYKFNVHSQTLIATSFNPELAKEWGELEGESGLWLQKQTLWGTGLTLRRSAYNGRNYEYISEDPMLTNVLGREIIAGCMRKGTLNGPKHIGANDQEHQRLGLSEFMTEQKIREGDLRGFEGALSKDEGGGLAVMVAFNRIGATPAACSRALNYNILRQEWAYHGLISTDMCNGTQYYFDAASIINATVTQIADFDSGSADISSDVVMNNWDYLTLETAKLDNRLVENAREAWGYQLYAFANSAVNGITSRRLTTWYDTALANIKVASIVLTAVAAAAFVTLTLVNLKTNKKEEE